MSVCLFVCVVGVHVCEHISGTSRPSFTEFFYSMSPMALDQSLCGGVTIRCVLLVLPLTYLHIMG